ncbi:MAG: NfeD family protein, partial [Burkholderiaceae bacterium]|nr:NfeD family protein [Burkholderiaceae bacterium]
MDAGAATWWWIGAGLLVAAELASGSFYMVMLALGM